METSASLFEGLDIVAHLFFAAGTMDRVAVHVDGKVVFGRLRYPDLDGDGLLVEVEPFAPGWPGAPVFIEYGGEPSDAYRFYSEIVQVGPRGLRVRVPRAVERGDPRLTPRVRIPPSADVVLHLDGTGGTVPCPVVDLSEGGVAFVDRTGWNLGLEHVLYGTLDLGQGTAFPVGVQLRSARAESGERVLGGRFAEITLDARAALSRQLVDWCSVRDLAMVS